MNRPIAKTETRYRDFMLGTPNPTSRESISRLAEVCSSLKSSNWARSTPLEYLIEPSQAFRSILLEASEDLIQQPKIGCLIQFAAERKVPYRLPFTEQEHTRALADGVAGNKLTVNR
jgi:hypothetical protein